MKISDNYIKQESIRESDKYSRITMANKLGNLHLILSGSTFEILLENDKECLKQVCIIEFKLLRFKMHICRLPRLAARPKFVIRRGPLVLL